MSDRRNGLVVAGLSSGSGKTVATMALLRGLSLRGFDVAPMKCGPDFIDPRFHEACVPGPSFNLDRYFLSEEGLRKRYETSVFKKSGGVVEGVMGIFDGETKGTSTADIARTLDLPVILVINAKGLAETIKALVKGVMVHAPGLRILGVIATFTGSKRHGDILREALGKEGLPPLLGTIDRNVALELPERHLGLVGVKELSLTGFLDRFMDAIDSGVVPGFSWEVIEQHFLKRDPKPEISQNPGTVPFWGGIHRGQNGQTAKLRLGIAWDRAFSFYYPENLEMLSELGVSLIPFSPMEDSSLPEGLDGLLFGGGYPELYAEELSANQSMKKAVRSFSRTGAPIIGECGGFLYLTRGPRNHQDGELLHEFAGLFPTSFVMGEKLRRLGYAEVSHPGSGPFGSASGFVRGHIFHYSFLLNEPLEEGSPSPAFLKSGENEGMKVGNVLGSYLHLYFPSNPEYASSLVASLAESHANKTRFLY
ncbi:MAG: cobyrinate a,c-diamide synthase [Leptospirillum sp.]|jgi:cobyrinic acid a,c-diamide synthase